MTGSASIEPLLERLLAGEPVSEADAVTLFESRDLLSLGMAADELRRRRHGTRVTFVRVADVALETAVAGEATWEGTPGEIRLVGVPANLTQAVAGVTAVVAASGGVPVTGFSLAGLESAAGGVEAVGEWVAALRRAGLAAVAEAPVDELQSPDGLFRVLGSAGLPVARLTVTRVPDAERPALLARAASLVTAHPWIDVFAPLPRKAGGLTPSTGYDDVHLVALARLLVPVSHIQVDWHRYGPKLAQVALTFGADDVDGVSPKDDVDQGPRRSPLEEIRRNIQAASGEPVERRALFIRQG